MSSAVPEHVVAALATIGVQLGEIDLDNPSARVAVRIGGEPHLLSAPLDDGFDPTYEQMTGPQASVVRACRRHLERNGVVYAVWVGRIAGSMMNSRPDERVRESLLTLRADAGLWHGLVTDDDESEILTLVDVPLNGTARTVPIPVSVAPSTSAEDEFGWTAEALVGANVSLPLWGGGLCSLLEMRNVLLSVLDDVEFPEPAGTCVMPHHAIDLATGWNEANRTVKMLATLHGACVDCASRMATSHAPDIMVKPQGWEKKV